MRPSNTFEASRFAWLTLPAELPALERVIAFVVEGARAAKFPEEQLGKLELVLEEVVVNVIHYAYPADAPGSIEIGFGAASPGTVRVQVRDAGQPFDPLSADAPDPKLDLEMEERPIGKLGIFLVKQLTDSIGYERADGKNILTFEVGANSEK